MSPHRRVSEGIVQIPEGRLVLANMTVRENLELGAFRRPASETRSTIAAMEERFPILAERRKSLAGTLSGGEQQMLAIARGLMAKPKLLLLDEPSLGLAPLLVQTIFEIVGELHSEGLTILLVEQNARQALSVSSHGYVMESGKIVLDGSAKQLMADQAVIDFYLGQVQTPVEECLTAAILERLNPRTRYETRSSGLLSPGGEPSPNRCRFAQGAAGRQRRVFCFSPIRNGPCSPESSVSAILSHGCRGRSHHSAHHPPPY